MRPRPAALALACALALPLGACGSSSGGRGRGSVSVLYAGSLVGMMEHDLGPAFARATGFGYAGVGAGSSELAAEIKGGVREGDVFISASPSVDSELEGAAGGRHVDWFATFATGPLVIGYDPHSRYAAQLRREPWYRVLTEPGIKVGITDPKLDPKGRLTMAAVGEAASRLGLPRLRAALPRFAVFPEESLVGRLQAGQLDAGFLYANEAAEQRIPTVPIAPATAHATYTVTVLEGAHERRGAEAFVAFLLGAGGRAILRAHGLAVPAPTLTGSPTAVPPGLRGAVGSG